MNKDIKNIIDMALQRGANIEIKMDGDKCDINITQSKPEPVTIPYRPNDWITNPYMPWTITYNDPDVVPTVTTAGWTINASNYFRDSTDEERNSTKAYIDSISEPTGVNWNDYIGRD